LLIARLEFWKLVVKDLAYLLGTVVSLGAWAVTSRTVTLTMLFAAMGVGAIAAVVVGVAQVPPRELRNLGPGWSGVAEVASSAGWRSLQAALRPAACSCRAC
jgi:hypothetical protein